MSDQNQIHRLVKKGDAIRENCVTSSAEIENYMRYVHEKAGEQSSLLLCGACSRTNSNVSQSFKRAFKAFNQLEKAELFVLSATILNRLMNPKQQSKTLIQNDSSEKTISLNCEEGKQWRIKQFIINKKQKTLTSKSTGQILDLHHYLLRKSKKKDREALVLESTEKSQTPQTIRLSYHKGSFQQLSTLLKSLIEEAMRDNLQKILQREKLIPSKEKRQSIKLIKKQNSVKLNASLEEILQETKKQNRSKNHQESKLTEISETSFEKILNNLENLDNFERVRENVFYNKKQNRLQKRFFIKDEVSLTWLSDNFTNFTHFSKWKSSLVEAKLLDNKNNNKNLHAFLETHEYRNKMTCSYEYNRQKVSRKDCLCFFDRSLQKAAQNSFGLIEYCIYKIWQQNDVTHVLMEGKITHGNKLNAYNRDLTEQFLGDMSSAIEKLNVHLENDQDVTINTAIFEEQYVSMINFLDIDDDFDQFYSIEGSEDITPSITVNPPIFKNFLEPILTPISNQNSFKKKIKQTSTSQPHANLDLHSDNLLKYKHPIVAFEKGPPKYFSPKEKGNVVYFENEWKVTSQGEVININQQKIKAQNSVLGQILKSIGRNLFSGKSILNVSLPVTVFGVESNLSQLCKSYAYAPHYMERACKQKDPVQRFAHTIAFLISNSAAYFKMDKPFNPILGETYQSLLDGCLVYGEQISHHPPISATFIKGRGYTISGSFEAKVHLGMNTATGGNDGWLSISFSEKNIKNNVIKCSFPEGGLSGLSIGDRKFFTKGKTYYLDYDNLIYLELEWGKHKGKTEYCKFHDSVEGKVVKLKSGTDVSDIKKIKLSSVETEYGIISGRWTNEVYFDDEEIFNLNKDLPFSFQNYPCPLQSDVYFRQDLNQRVKDNLEKAQTAKEDLQNIQRNDRKLRQKFTGKKQH